MNKEREIIADYDKLSIRCDEIDVRKENNLMREITVALKDTMKEKDIVALSAPQIGYDKRIFVMNFSGEYKTFINPIITRAENFTLSQESCHSIPDKTYIRPRHNSIYITYQTPLGKIESRQLIGIAAILFQHHIDHLDGLLLNDVGFEVTDKYENASDKEKAKMLKEYKESLDLKSNELKETIENDETLKKMSDAIDFMTAVQKGEVTVKQEQVNVERKEEDNGAGNDKD